MARLISSNFGDIRGSVGNTVFSRNKSGAIMRTRVTGTNPNTVGQQNARQNMSTASQAWQSLTNAQRQSWNEFAKTSFIPFMKQQNGTTSGFQAFVSLYQSALMAAQNADTMHIEIAAPISAVTYEDFAPLTNAPAFYTTGSPVYSGINSPFEVQWGSTLLANDGTFHTAVTLQTYTSDSPWVDSFGNHLGLCFYISNSLKYEGMATKGQFRNLLAVLPPMATISDSYTTGPMGFGLVAQSNILQPEYKYGLLQDATYQITACAITAGGMTVPFDSAYVLCE